LRDFGARKEGAEPLRGGLLASDETFSAELG
jgi:hypothetical protein